MSLNRYEQGLHDYIEGLPEEKRYWTARVLEIAGESKRREEMALDLNAALWEYFEERSRCDTELASLLDPTRGKVSMLNLSEYLLRMWTPIVPRKRAAKNL